MFKLYSAVGSGVKYVYPPDTMKALRGFFAREIAARFPQARILYWT